MLACRRTSTFAARALARQSQRQSVGAAGRTTTALGRCLLSSLPDHIVVGMPALSPTMTHGNIGTWGKQAGDEISAGDIVCEVETDKATVDFDAQDDSFMAKHLVEAGTQDIPVGTPIFVTVEDAESVAAFKDFTPGAAEAPVEPEPEPVAQQAPAPPAIEESVAAAAPAAPVALAPTPAPAPVAAAGPVADVPVKTSGSGEVPFVFKREWGSGVSTSPLAHRLTAEQKRYIARFGDTLQQPSGL